MNLGFSDIGLSSMISNHITISSDGDSGVPDISVSINNKVIYSTTLYPMNGDVHLYDLGVLVNDYMRSHALAYCKLDVAVEFDHQGDYATVYVVFSSIGTSYEFGSDFLYRHFLTTRSSYTIPRSKWQEVAFFCAEDDQSPSGYYDLSVRFSDGSYHSVRIPHILYDTRENRIYYFTIMASSLEAQLRNMFPNDNPKVLGGSVIHGYRSLNFYFVDEEPIDYFYFANAFNVMETYNVYGVTNIKTQFIQKEAVSSGFSTYYNQSFEQKIQIETVPLALEEAEWLNQFLSSPKIIREISPDLDGLVLLSDMSSEISSSAKDMNTIKFSWKYADNYTWKSFISEHRIFANKFNETYH